MTSPIDSAVTEIADVLDDAGLYGWVCAESLDDVADRGTGRSSISIGADVKVPAASLYKLVVAIAWARQVDAGERTLSERVTILPGERTSGPTGLSLFEDRVDLSERDLVRMMLTVSDNTAADHVLHRVGLSAVSQVCESLGLGNTDVRGGTGDGLRVLASELRDMSTAWNPASLASVDVTSQISAYDAALSSSTTPRDLVHLFRSIWSNDAATAASCGLLRSMLGQQVWTHRLAAAFPYDDVKWSGKTGTLGALRHEAGVVEFAGEVPVAIAVMTRSARSELSLPSADAAIARVGRIAAGALRRPARRRASQVAVATQRWGVRPSDTRSP